MTPFTIINSISDSCGRTVSAVTNGILFKGELLAWGSDPRFRTLPIVNLPVGYLRVKRRLRNKDFAWAFVRMPDGIRKFALREVDNGGLELCLEQASNQRDRIPTKAAPLNISAH